jgi:hypothetical protein
MVWLKKVEKNRRKSWRRKERSNKDGRNEQEVVMKKRKGKCDATDVTNRERWVHKVELWVGWMQEKKGNVRRQMRMNKDKVRSNKIRKRATVTTERRKQNRWGRTRVEKARWNEFITSK